VTAFGLGMAATLAAVGLVVLRLRERAEQRALASPTRHRSLARVLALLPLITAVAVTGLGLLVAARAGISLV
jgi:hypothetical protein